MLTWIRVNAVFVNFKGPLPNSLEFVRSHVLCVMTSPHAETKGSVAIDTNALSLRESVNWSWALA